MDSRNQFFVDNEVVKTIGGQAAYDKFAIASTLFDVSFQGAACHLLEAQILNDCNHCNLRPICKEIDKIVDEYIEKTTVVKESFTFD